MLSYRTFFAEYSGVTAESVVQSIYVDAQSATGLSFDEWWEYQRQLWSDKYARTIPPRNAPDAALKLLEMLVELGALETTAKSL